MLEHIRLNGIMFMKNEYDARVLYQLLQTMRVDCAARFGTLGALRRYPEFGAPI